MVYICTGHEVDVNPALLNEAFPFEAWCDTCKDIQVHLHADVCDLLDVEVDVTVE